MRLSSIAFTLAACAAFTPNALAYDALTFNACPPIRVKQKCDAQGQNCSDELDANGNPVLDETKPDLTCKYTKIPPTCKQIEAKDDCIKNPPKSKEPCGEYQGCIMGGAKCGSNNDCDIGGECIEGACRYMQLYLGVKIKDMTLDGYLGMTSAQKSDWDFLFMQEMSFAAAGSPSQFYIRDQFDDPKGGFVQIVATQPYVSRKDWAALGYQALFYNAALKDETSRLRTTFPKIDETYPPCYMKLTDPKAPFKGAKNDVPNLVWTEIPCPSNKYIDPTLA